MKKIFVRFQREGIHRYPAAEFIEGVEFLAHPHRHIFHFEVQIEVFTDDRDIEFILFKRFCEGLFDQKVLSLDYKSCEMISNQLSIQIQKKYPGRNMTIIVSEDNENGSIIDYEA